VQHLWRALRKPYLPRPTLNRNPPPAFACATLLQVRTQRGASVFPEVDAAEVLLRYRTSNAGCCKILLHPQWGSSVYPASVVVCAPLTAILEGIAAVGGPK
jgi:hypothetical protein